MAEEGYSTGKYLRKNLKDIVVETSHTSSSPGTAKSLRVGNNHNKRNNRP